MIDLKNKCVEAAMIHDVMDEAVKDVYMWAVDGIRVTGSKRKADTIDHIIYVGIRTIIEEVRREARATEPYKHKTTPAAKSVKATASVVDAICKYNFFMRHKVNNKALGDCTKADVEWARDHHAKMSMGNKRRSSFYEWLSGKMTGKKMVKNSVKESMAEEAYRRFLNGEKIAFV